jgi:hypothetical protein
VGIECCSSNKQAVKLLKKRSKKDLPNELIIPKEENLPSWLIEYLGNLLQHLYSCYVEHVRVEIALCLGYLEEYEDSIE